MIAILIIIAIVLAAAAFAVYGVQRTSLNPSPDHSFPPPSSVGLFDNQEPEPASLVEDNEAATKQRALTIERAGRGELAALAEAHASGDANFYSEVLDALVEQASERQEDLRALVTHIAQSNELRANTRLAERVMDDWKTRPGRRATVEMLHIGALSDDAATYEHAVEMVFEFWRRGQLSAFRPEELTELFVSQFWVLAPEARRGGVGFALKRKLLGIRRELAAAAPAR